VRRSIVSGIAIAGAVFLADQAVKHRIDRWVADEPVAWQRRLLGPVDIAYTKNRGVAFGLLRGQSDVVLLAVALVVLAIVVAFVVSMRQSPWVVCGGSMVIGGALGNAVNRARLGYVRDFFSVGPWPAFNVADAAITCGVVLIALGIALAESGARSGQSLVAARRRNMEWSE
jgi:signal peptidase II